MTQAEALSLFEYKDGMLFSRIKRNRLTPGSRAGCLDMSIGKGYYTTTVNKKKYSIHRIIFLMHKGWLPEFIDHKDGDSQNNKIENLRPATKQQNSCNRGKQSDNKSGFKGVSWCAANKKWRAQITINRKKSLYRIV